MSTYYRLQYLAVKRHIEEKMRIEVTEEATKQSQALLKEDKIIVNRNLKYENKVYTILHEAGHFLIYRSKSYNKNYIEGYHHIGIKGYNSRILVLDEELRSWERGLKLAERVPIRINRRRYEEYKGKMLRGYLQWVLDRNRKRWRDD